MASSARRHDPFRDDGDGSDDDFDPDGEDEPKLSTRFQARDMRACLAVVVERLEYEMGRECRPRPRTWSSVLNRRALRARTPALPRGMGQGRPEQVVLSTVHRAKGLEWDTVYLLQPDDLPLWARHGMGRR